ncbi:MAG: nucleotide exchange factor GrpE [Clostridiales bacterium]|jgi:molecular chaperone GrpE|nr:nucleotide exchange factor GrpE [Clostridiales bacterium]
MKKQTDNQLNKEETQNGGKQENTEKDIPESRQENTEQENDIKNQNEKPESKSEKEGKNKQYDELNDKFIRLYAEYDNYRKRTEKEKAELFQAGLVSAIEMFIPLLDNLERALSFEPENEGLILLCKLVKDTFDKLGVSEIESDGKTFDPELHNAVMHEEDSEKGENIIVQTFQKGYTLNGKVIRHAVVKVVN